MTPLTESHPSDLIAAASSFSEALSLLIDGLEWDIAHPETARQPPLALVLQLNDAEEAQRIYDLVNDDATAIDELHAAHLHLFAITLEVGNYSYLAF